MRDVTRTGETVVVSGQDRSLTYRPRRVTLDDGTWVAHESRGGSLSSVWAVDLGDRFIEVVHLGAGPLGGELVVVVPDADVVIVGDLVAEPGDAPVRPSWPAAVDLAIGLTRPTSRIMGTDRDIERGELEDLHQRLLGLVHGTGPW